MISQGKISVIGANDFTKGKVNQLVLPGNSGNVTPANPDFISTWDTTQAGSASDTVVLPLLSGGTYSGTIDWGDGNTSALSYANRQHTYAASGTYTITISGIDIQGFKFNNSGDRRKITDISNWGNLTITTDLAFYGCSNLDISATDAPNITTTILRGTFRGCSSLTTPDFTAWDISTVTNLQMVFHSCSNFNGDVSTWDTSNVTTFGFIQSNIGFGTFYNCTSFNSDISNWSFASALDINGLLWGCNSFNQDITTWDVSNVQSMYGLFFGCSSFNQDISGWDVSSVSQMSRMFERATTFNQDLSSWDYSSVTSANSMFRDAESFNQDITSLVNNSSITSLLGLVYDATSFNQDVSGWDVSSITNFSRLFRNCNAAGFNPNVAGWNTSSLVIVSDGQGGTFQNVDGFDRDLSGWDITNMTTANSFFMKDATGLSTANYDATLIGWEAQLQAAFPGGVGYTPVITINFGGSTYTLGGSAATARASLISNFGWTITDGGGV